MSNSASDRSADWTVALSHGTLETKNLDAARRFYAEFLGLETVRRGELAVWVRCGGGWMVACVNTGENMQPPPPDIRWCLDLASADELQSAHADAVRLQAEYGMQEVLPIKTEGTQSSFLISDVDGNWWEICHRPGRLFDHVFESANAEAA